MKPNRRVQPRSATTGLMSCLCDGTSVCIGVVGDISSRGLLISQIPSSFREGAEKCVSIVYGPEEDLRITVGACWTKSTHKGMYKTIGFHIDSPPRLWKNFVDEVSLKRGPDHNVGFSVTA